MADDDGGSKPMVVLPNVTGDFHGFNIDKWADTARAVVSYNVLDSVEKYVLAVDHFENSLICLIEKDEKEGKYTQKVEDFIKTLEYTRLGPIERSKKIADFKLRELTKLVDRFRKKTKSYVIDPVKAREEIMARQAQRKKIEVVSDGGEPESTAAV